MKHLIVLTLVVLLVGCAATDLIIYQWTVPNSYECTDPLGSCNEEQTSRTQELSPIPPTKGINTPIGIGDIDEPVPDKNVPSNSVNIPSRPCE